MALTFHFSYRFYPVGQGLFSSGYLMREGATSPEVAWVYDCGTSSSQILIDQGLDQLGKELGDHAKLDLLVLSHFDHDHISGVCRLLERFRIGTLMLPYMPLAQRLVIAFEEGQGAPQSALAPFFINPVEFFLAQNGSRIDRFLFVLPSVGDGPPTPPEGPHRPDDDGGRGADFSFKPGKPDDRDEVQILLEAAKRSGKPTSVEFLSPGSALVYQGLWEFVPYNDDPSPGITPAFAARVHALRSHLLGSRRLHRNAALNMLKQAYDDYFGDKSAQRNLISLYLYAGPIYPSWTRTWLTRARADHQRWQQRFEYRHVPASSSGVPYGNSWCSLLYTGDGFLDTSARLKNLITYLHEDRVDSTGVLQVMHHGAESNWHAGVATAIRPLFSVFSAFCSFFLLIPSTRFPNENASYISFFTWPRLATLPSVNSASLERRICSGR